MEFLKYRIGIHRMLVATDMPTPGGKGEGGIKTVSKVSHLANGSLEML